MNTKQAQRTPGPWRVEPIDDKSPPAFHCVVTADESDWHCVASTWGGPNEADAAFIVRACNAHDDLLAALRQIENVLHPDAETYSPLVRGTRECGEVIQNIVNAARAALAKAEA